MTDEDDRVERWHTMSADEWRRAGHPDLHTYLGMTWEEYKAWTEAPALLRVEDSG